MCLAQPREVVSVGAETARVRTGGREREVSTMLVPDLRVGDYVIVAGDIVVERLDPAEAEVRLAIFDELEKYTDERA
jgi:hydrogenase expression/formation protein HypC